MSETIEVKKDIEVTVKCSVCGDEIEFYGTSDSYGDITIEVGQCDCFEDNDE
jgi:hypothetical protein